MSFDYAGLNHLGWISRIRLRGEDITDRVLDDLGLLRRIAEELNTTGTYSALDGAVPYSEVNKMLT